MLIDDITSISINLGIVRIQGQKMNPDGVMENLETIEIPAAKIGDIVNKLASGVTELNEKVTVNFENVGKKVININNVNLEKISNG